MNHPTKIIFQYLSQEIINYLNIPNTINYYIDPLDYVKCILYTCIQSDVEFDISECSLNLYDTHGVLPITNLYYYEYNKNKLTYCNLNFIFHFHILKNMIIYHLP
jgi:hypothetical protein